MRQGLRFTASFGFCGAILFLLLAIAAPPVRAQTLPIGANASLILFNPVTNKYYVAGTPMSVINGATNAVTPIPGTTYPEYSAFALNTVTNKIYVIEGIGALGLTVIDGATNAVSRIPLPSNNGCCIAVNTTTNKIYIANDDAPGTVTVVDGATNAVTLLTAGTSNDAIAVNPVTNKIYVASTDTPRPIVTVIDGATNATTDLNVPGAVVVNGLGNFMAVNTTTNKIYLGASPAAAIDGATNAVTNLGTPAGGFLIGSFAYNPVTNNLYIGTVVSGNNALTQDGIVTVINGTTGAATPITVGIAPEGIAVNTATNTIMVTNELSNALTEINGATNATTTLPAGNFPQGVAVNPATNQFYVINDRDSTVSVIAGPAGTPVTPPAITSSPQNQSASVGQSVTFTGAASGSPTYQWLFNGAAIVGATNASLTLTSITAASAGTYTFVATNGGGSVTANATLSVSSPTPPAFTTQPIPQTVVSGTTVVFNSAANGVPAPTYQWRLNSVNVAGATSARLVVTSATATAGTYTCVATNSQGSATSAGAALTLTSTVNVGRLINLSVNTTAGKSQVLTVGFVSGGAGTTGNENLLIRATGPALAGLGVPNTLADPTLTVLSGSTVLVANDNWGTPASNQTAVTAADTATFAFPLSNPASLDAAVAQPFAAGADTAQVSGNTTASGTVLAEVYDNTPTASYTLATPRLVNLSAKNQIVAGGSMTAGFVVGGSTAKTVLIRATGPALALLGVPGTIPDPQIALHTTINSQDTVLATNAGWGGDPQITAASNSVFAFPLTNAASADSVVLVTLAPGAYTAVASSVSGAAGTVLIEVYEVP